MNEFEALVDRALLQARLAWIAHALVAVLLLALVLSGWWLLVIPVYLSITYQATIWLTAQSLTRQAKIIALAEAEADRDSMANLDDIHRRLESGELVPGPELYELMEQTGLHLSVVETASEEKIGTLGDFEIFEWVEMYDPDTKKVERFHFHDFADRERDGTPIMPHIEGKKSSILGGGVVYTRDLQPAQG